MTLHKNAMIGALIGWFILSELVRALSSGSIKLIFNVAVDGIIGVGLSIALGYFFGWVDKKWQK